jgi:hypothetical protein
MNCDRCRTFHARACSHVDLARARDHEAQKEAVLQQSSVLLAELAGCSITRARVMLANGYRITSLPLGAAIPNHTKENQ